MNIKDVTGTGGTRPADSSREKSNARPKPSSANETGGASSSDQLSLTAVGRYLAENTESTSAPVNRERVDAIRLALANGTYEIDSERVAVKLLNMENRLAQSFRYGSNANRKPARSSDQQAREDTGIRNRGHSRT